MSTRTELRRTQVSPAVAVILGLLLLAANIAVRTAVVLPIA